MSKQKCKKLEKEIGKKYNYVVSSNDKFYLPMSENITITIIGGGGGGGGALYDNTNDNVANYYSAGGGGGGCGEKRIFYIKKCLQPLRLSINIGKGGLGGIGGILGKSLNGQNGQETTIHINKRKYKARGGHGGYFGTSSKNGGNGGMGGGGGGGGFTTGGLGGSELYGIPKGENGQSNTSPQTVFMDGGSGSLNPNSGGIGKSFALNGSVYNVGGGGGGCLTGIGGSCDIPAITCIGESCELAGGGGGGGAGFDLSFVGESNGANGQNGQVTITGMPIIYKTKKCSKQCKITNSTVENLITNVIAVQKSIVPNVASCEYSNPCYVTGSYYGNRIFDICNYTNYMDLTSIVATMYKFYRKPFLSIEIGAGGGRGGNAFEFKNTGGGGGGSGGIINLLSSFDISSFDTSTLTYKLIAIIGGPGTQQNKDGGPTSACFSYMVNPNKSIYIPQSSLGGSAGEDVTFLTGDCAVGGIAIEGYGGGGSGTVTSGVYFPCDGGLGLLGFGSPGNFVRHGEGGSGGGPYGGRGGGADTNSSSGGGGGGGSGINSYNIGAYGGTYDLVPGIAGYSGGGGGSAGHGTNNTDRTGGDGGAGYVKISLSSN